MIRLSCQALISRCLEEESRLHHWLAYSFVRAPQSLSWSATPRVCSWSVLFLWLHSLLLRFRVEHFFPTQTAIDSSQHRFGNRFISILILNRDKSAKMFDRHGSFQSGHWHQRLAHVPYQARQSPSPHRWGLKCLLRELKRTIPVFQLLRRDSSDRLSWTNLDCRVVLNRFLRRLYYCCSCWLRIHPPHWPRSLL